MVSVFAPYGETKTSVAFLMVSYAIPSLLFMLAQLQIMIAEIPVAHRLEPIAANTVFPVATVPMHNTRDKKPAIATTPNAIELNMCLLNHL